MKWNRNIFIFLMWLIATWPAFAADKYQSLDVIKLITKQFLQQHIEPQSNGKLEIALGNLDPRLQLPTCPLESLSPYLPPGNNGLRTSIVGIRCTSNTPW